MAMKDSLRTGFCFGLTSGIITTLGLMVGLNSGTGSKLAVIGGILTIAVADAFSDALGIHISEESENAHSTREVWESTVFTFVSKFLVAMTFIVPVLLFDLSKAIMASLIWGFLVLGILSFFLARGQERNPWKVVAEHLIILMVVVIATDLVGSWIGAAFG
jgi:VIT1/CCC1 family predicted Fe2+/Mn2+ transporter